MKNQIKILIGILVSIGCLFSAYAQGEENDGKITVEITKEINGEKKTFKGEYENEEQMKADPNYQEFAGDDHDFTFMLDRDSDAKLWIDQFYDDNHSMFKFRFNDDSLNLTDLQDWAAVDWKKHLKDLDIDVDALIHRFDRNGSGSNYTKDSKKIRISEIEGDELGKKGIVKKNEKLE
ncbi:MAG: hypothetical protein AAGA66_21830, partial [Bacteroidota bacterium]